MRKYTVIVDAQTNDLDEFLVSLKDYCESALQQLGEARGQGELKLMHGESVDFTGMMDTENAFGWVRFTFQETNSGDTNPH